jgi:hypothetical protein
VRNELLTDWSIVTAQWNGMDFQELCARQAALESLSRHNMASKAVAIDSLWCGDRDPRKELRQLRRRLDGVVSGHGGLRSLHKMNRHLDSLMELKHASDDGGAQNNQLHAMRRAGRRWPEDWPGQPPYKNGCKLGDLKKRKYLE